MMAPAKKRAMRGGIGTQRGGVEGKVGSVTGYEELQFGNSESVAITEISGTRGEVGLGTHRVMGLDTDLGRLLDEHNLAI